MTEVERPQVVLVNRCIIHDNDGRILLVKRSADDSYNPGLWELPGGKLDIGQDLSTALQREVEEETGLDVESQSPIVYSDSYVINDGKYKGLPYVLLVGIGKVVGGSLSLSHEHDDSAWEDYQQVFEYDLTPESEKALRALGNLGVGSQ